MAAAQATNVVHLMLEKVRKKLPLLYERSDSLFSTIQKREVQKVSTRNARIPLQIRPGGVFGYASFDGADLGRGSMTEYSHAELTPQGVKFAVEINKLIEYASNSSEKAVADATKLEVANAMKQFRRDLDAQLQTAGNGVSATVSGAPTGTVITCAATPFGARLIRPGMKILAYDSGMTTQRNGGTAMTVSDVQSGLGQTQTIKVNATTGVQDTDVIVPDGLSGASPVGFFGIPYHHNRTASGTWLSLDRGNNPFTVADMVNANSAGFAVPFARLALDKLMQNIGIDEVEAMRNFVWYGNRAQRAAIHEIAWSIATLEKKGSDQPFDPGFGQETLLGIKTKWNIHADPTRLDLLNMETWGRVEWQPIDYLEVGGNTVFPVYGASGGIAAAYLFYLIAGMQYFVDNPKAIGGIDSLALPDGY